MNNVSDKITIFKMEGLTMKKNIKVLVTSLVVFFMIFLLIAFLITKYKPGESITNFIYTLLGAFFALIGGYAFQTVAENNREKKAYKEKSRTLYIYFSRLLNSFVKDIIQCDYSGISKEKYSYLSSWEENAYSIIDEVISKNDFENLIDIHSEIECFPEKAGTNELYPLGVKVFHEKYKVYFTWFLRDISTLKEKANFEKPDLSDCLDSKYYEILEKLRNYSQIKENV